MASVCDFPRADVAWRVSIDCIKNRVQADSILFGWDGGIRSPLATPKLRD